MLCGGISLSVESSDADLSEQACNALDSAQPQFERCGLIPPRPLNLKIVIGGLANESKCLASYHCDDDIIFVMSPQAMSTSQEMDNPFSRLPESALFGSLVVHEATHALLYSLRNGPGRTFVEDEYIAYAMQLAWLSTGARQQLLEAQSVSGPIGMGDLGEKVLMFSPTVFAINSWLHFDAPGHGCAFVQRILNEEINFAN